MKSPVKPRRSRPGAAVKTPVVTPSHDSVVSGAVGVAHDLNTVLTLIYGYSELALEGLHPDSESGRNIRKIIESADRAKAITGQLLANGIEADQVRRKVPVKDVLRETLESLRPLVNDRINLIEEDVTPEVCVSADRIQLFRVFLNLAGNAVQAMEENGGTLTVTLDTRKGDEVMGLRKNNTASDEYALIRFADTGPGMDEKTATRIFEPFFTSGKHGNGTGLGLSVVSGIISRIGGEIIVETEKGKGTVIEVLIPSLTGGKKK